METKQFVQEIYSYINANKTLLLEDWFELIRHPSISATGEGVEECCCWLMKKMTDMGIDVTRYPLEPYPVLVGRYGNDADKKNSFDLCPL